MVSRDDLERCLGEVRGEVRDPVAGIHGPGTMSWRLHREGAVFVGGGRAAFLQLAHPYVAHAVLDHSETRTDIQGRFQRTFSNVYAMVFGDLDRAFRSARRVHAIHERIVGTITEDVGAYAAGHAYHANEEEALLWVYATLVDTAIIAHDRLVAPLSDGERGRYYAESRRFARLFGISDRVLPADWPAFQRYMAGMVASDTLTVGSAAREIASFLLAPPTLIHRPVLAWYGVITAGLLPPRQREMFGLPFDRAEKAVFAASMAALGQGYRRLPPRLRFMPAYVEARDRLRGLERKDRVGRALERALFYGMAPPRRAG